jgi:hypothetical protein
MRAIIAIVLVAAACGGSNVSSIAQNPSTLPTGTPDSGGGTPDGGVLVDAGPPDSGAPVDAGTPDSGPPVDTGTPDSGTPVDAGPPDSGTATGTPPDAGVATIAELPCATPPQPLWSRPFADSSLIDFRGTSDAQGNLYWVEYAQRPTEEAPAPAAMLVSADSSGNDRYRTPFSAPGGDFKISGSTLVATSHGVVTGFDTATGQASWSVDIANRFFAANDNAATTSGGLLDLGTGRVAVAMGDATFGGIFILDAATGNVVANQIASGTPRFRLLSSDGQGHALAAANAVQFDSFSGNSEIYLVDDSGNFVWIDLVSNFRTVINWTPGALPWLDIGGASTSTPGPHFLSVPDGWAEAAATRGGVALADLSFSMAGPTGGGVFPLKLDFVIDGAVVSSGLFSEISTFNGASIFNFPGSDHATFVTQQFNAQPGLCHPGTAGVAYLGTVNDTSATLCKLTLPFDSGIVAVVPSAGNLVLGRYIVSTESCNINEVDPFVIEAYARP